MNGYGVVAALLCMVAFAHAGAIANPFLPKEVEGIISCGSEAHIEDITITDCRLVPCQAYVGNKYRIDIKFRPRHSHEQLHLNIVLIHGGESTVIVDGPVENSGVEAGMEYTFGYEYSITGAFEGPAQIAFNLLGKFNGNDFPELCFYVGIVVITPP